MGFRFRQRLKVIPGVYLNVSPGGMSVSIGGRGATVNVSHRGTRLTVGIPGSGVSYQTKIVDTNRSTVSPVEEQRVEAGSPSFDPTPVLPGFKPVKSAAIDTLANGGALELRDMIYDAYRERLELEQEVKRLQQVAETARQRVAWLDNWLCKRLFKSFYARRHEAFRIAQDEAADAEQALSDYGVKIEWSLAPDITEIYDMLIEKFKAASETFDAWSTVAIRQMGYHERIVERTISNWTVQREKISLRLSRPRYLPIAPAERWPNVPTISKSDGSNIYIFPSFLIFESGANFAVIEPDSICVNVYSTRFTEFERIPGDSRTIGNTWRYANKNGTPDRRYNDNPAIPIVEYGALDLSSNHIDERFMMSNAITSVAFGQAFDSFCGWYKHAKTYNTVGTADATVIAQSSPLRSYAHLGWIWTDDPDNPPVLSKTFSDSEGERYRIAIATRPDTSYWIEVQPMRDDTRLSSRTAADPAAIIVDGRTTISCASLLADYERRKDSKTLPPVQWHGKDLWFELTPPGTEQGWEAVTLALMDAKNISLRLTLASGEQCALDFGADNFHEMTSEITKGAMKFYGEMIDMYATLRAQSS